MELHDPGMKFSMVVKVFNFEAIGFGSLFFFSSTKSGLATSS